MNNNKIFIQIASYRDPELKNTLKDLFNKSKFPENLKVCIAWQHSSADEWDNLDEFKNDSRLDIIDIDYSQSKGACWARNLIQQRYSGEEYTLQLDSHHRFVQNWDEICINTLKDLQAQGSKKPLLTSYIPSYNPSNDPEERVDSAWGMSFHKFTPEGIVFFLPYYMSKQITKPIRARFFSAHFAFTLGSHCLEVQHDPEYYFHGEEITLAVRSFTHGYDLYHPAEIIAWHEYTREGRTKQWDDDNTWHIKNVNTHKKVRKLLGVDGEMQTVPRKYGFGSQRTLKDYEAYSGITFNTRSINEACKNNLEPNLDTLSRLTIV